MLINLSTFRLTRTRLHSILLLGILSFPSYSGQAAEFPVGMDWQRQLDYAKGEEDGAPSAPSEEAPWHYSWGSAADEIPDVGAATPLVWQAKWFGHTRGVWAQAQDRLPLVEQKSLNISLNPPKSTATCFVRWRNPSSKSITVKLDATLATTWHGGDGSETSPAPLQVSLFILDHKGQAGENLFLQSVEEGTPETAFTKDDITLAPGDELVFAFRPEQLPGSNRYITVTDDITIKLVK